MKLSGFFLLVLFGLSQGQSQSDPKNGFGFDIDGTLFYRRYLTSWLTIGPRYNAGYFYTGENSQRGFSVGMGMGSKVINLVSLRVNKRIAYIVNFIELSLFKGAETPLNQEHSLPRNSPIYLEPKGMGWNLIELQIGYLFKLNIGDKVEFKPGIEFMRGYADISEPSLYGELLPKFEIEMEIKY